MVNVYEVSDDGEILISLKRSGSWPQQMVGARLAEIITDERDAVAALDLVKLVLRDGQERAIETSLRTPRGILYRRLTIYRYTKASVAIMATRTTAYGA